MELRILLWTLVLSTILGFGWYKATEKTIGHRIQTSSGYVEEFNPQPPRLSLTGRLEAIRQIVIHYGGWLWMVALAVALPTRRLGFFGAEVLLAISLALGTAYLVSPYFSLTISGVLSNDSLFLSAGMVAISVICLAFRLTQRGYQPRLQFGLQNILGTTAAVGGLFALGAFGLVALYVFAVGGVIFFVSC